MMITSLDGRYMEVNDAFCAIVGRSPAALIGLPHQSITHPDDLAQDDLSVQELLAGKTKSFVREKQFLHAAGHAVWTALSVTVIRDGHGKPTHFISQAQDITGRRQYENQLRHMADHDPLTGLLNRRSFQRELTSHVARVKRYGPTGAVLMVDLDNFKYYNDTEGHGAGDDLIVRIGQALQTRLRETDVLARLGGDEFAVLLTEEERDSAELVARDLLKVVRNEAPDPLHGEQRGCHREHRDRLLQRRRSSQRRGDHGQRRPRDVRREGKRPQSHSAVQDRPAPTPPHRGPDEMGQ
jgi:diguanylate cyclase (GGDEF)-like protein/PAS domain S-box-containing protein